jgi:hypothetical protein
MGRRKLVAGTGAWTLDRLRTAPDTRVPGAHPEGTGGDAGVNCRTDWGAPHAGTTARAERTGSRAAAPLRAAEGQRRVSADELALLSRRGWIHSTVEGMWENPLRVERPVSLPEALEIESKLVDPDEGSETRGAHDEHL